MLDFILVKDKKLICLILLLLIISLSLIGCNGLDGKEPYNYPNTHWVCRDPFITLKVDSTNRLKAYLGDEINGQEFQLCFGYGRDIYAFGMETTLVSDETILFQGTYRSYQDHFEITIKTENLWDDKYKDCSLYFERLE